MLLTAQGLHFDEDPLHLIEEQAAHACHNPEQTDMTCPEGDVCSWSQTVLARG